VTSSSLALSTPIYCPMRFGPANRGKTKSEKAKFCMNIQEHFHGLLKN